MVNELTQRLDSLKECEAKLKIAREIILKEASLCHEIIMMTGKFGGKTEQGTYYVKLLYKSKELTLKLAQIMAYADFNKCELIESDNCQQKFYFDVW